MQKKVTENSMLEEVAKRRQEADLIADVETDFATRQKERCGYERQWELNMNFLAGNQYFDLSSRGELTEDDKTFYWQGRGVFNHIAPIVESRLAKFSRVSPTVYVRPKTDDDKDVEAAALSEKVIQGVFKRSKVEAVVKKVTAWSETCGTGFYKIIWNNKGGNKVAEIDGEPVYEGDVEVLAISPFEIFPDNLYAGDIDQCRSIIHARATSVYEIKEKYGVSIVGGEIGVYDLASTSAGGYKNKKTNTMKNAVTVIERYERPSELFPNGRLVTVAGGKLLFVGDLPYINGEDESRSFPFVKQVSIDVAGNFFGMSVIERMIPVQRAYNAVKNRKHEFLNRLSMGVLTVEDGSVDVDDLSEDGLSPGKVLVYRQGAKAPELMSDITMPNDFNTEEDKLINEFVIVSGVSDVSSSSHNAALSSGSALEILVEQDNSRLVATAEHIRQAYLTIAKQAVRLFVQFGEGVRSVKEQDENNKVKIYYADMNGVSADDVYLESENELLYSHTQKKDMIFRLYSSGLLTDETGKLRTATKEKLLSLLGYKDLDYQKGISGLQEEKAQRENQMLKSKSIEIEEVDDHAIHVDEHTRFVLSEYSSLNEEQKQRYYEHLRAHKQKIKQEKNKDGE